MEDRERLMDCVLQPSAARDRVPSQITRERIRQLGSAEPGAGRETGGSGATESEEGNIVEKDGLVVRLLCTDVRCDAEALKEAIHSSLQV